MPPRLSSLDHIHKVSACLSAPNPFVSHHRMPSAGHKNSARTGNLSLSLGRESRACLSCMPSGSCPRRDRSVDVRIDLIADVASFLVKRRAAEGAALVGRSGCVSSGPQRSFAESQRLNRRDRSPAPSPVCPFNCERGVAVRRGSHAARLPRRVRCHSHGVSAARPAPRACPDLAGTARTARSHPAAFCYWS